MRYFSMFTWIGGFELGIHNAYRSQDRIGSSRETENQSTDGQGLFLETGQNPSTTNRRSRPSITNETDDGPLCVGYSEIDKYAIQTFETNFGKEIKNYGDATKINTAELPDFDLLVGGFPCQAFSIAGRRAGFEDTRGTLIFDVVRILRDKRPRYFILENVKGLLSHDSGKTFSHILEILTDTGYDVSWSIHNSKNYGVPQNRERIYLIGNLRGEPRPQVFPNEAHPRQDIVYDVKGSQRDRVYNREGLAPTVPTMQGGNTHPKIFSVKSATKSGYEPAAEGDSVNFSQPNSKTRRGRVGDQIANTLDTNVQQGVIAKTIRVGGQGSPHGSKQNWDSYEVNGVIRRLTPIECERLQGFPDNWTIGSDTQRYKQCGNAITVNVVEHVAKEILKCQS